jgi:hypothetical protein
MKRYYSAVELPYEPRTPQWEFLENMRVQSERYNKTHDDTNVHAHVDPGTYPKLHVKTVPAARKYADTLSPESSPDYRIVYSNRANKFVVITNVTDDMVMKSITKYITKDMIDTLGDPIARRAMADITKMSAEHKSNTTGGRRYRKAHKTHKARKTSKSRKAHRRH